MSLTATSEAGSNTMVKTEYVTVLRQGPAGNFTASPTNGAAPLTVQFNDTSSSTGSHPSYSWDFGDGGTATAKNPSYVYTSAGDYTVSLTVTDNKGRSDTEVKEGYVRVTTPAHCGFNLCSDINNQADYDSCIACNSQAYCEGLCANPACDLTGNQVTFGIENYTCSYGNWERASCGQNALLNWALEGDSARFKDILSTWRWRRTLDCPTMGHSYAFENPGRKDVYLVKVLNHDIDRPKNFDHEIAAELPTAYDPSEYDSWRFFNYGDLNIQKGVGTPGYPDGGQIPSGGLQCYTTVTIKRVTGLSGCGLYNSADVQKFWIDSNNNPVSSQLTGCTQDHILLQAENFQKFTSIRAANDLPDELKTIFKRIKFSNQFATSRWNIDSINHSLKIYTYDINDEQLINNLDGSNVANYTIQMIHDTEFETKREDVIKRLNEIKKLPDYQFSHISMNTDAFGDTPGYYAEVWVYQLTPENKELDNSMIGEWMIHVYPIS